MWNAGCKCLEWANSTGWECTVQKSCCANCVQGLCPTKLDCVRLCYWALAPHSHPTSARSHSNRDGRVSSFCHLSASTSLQDSWATCLLLAVLEAIDWLLWSPLLNWQLHVCCAEQPAVVFSGEWPSFVAIILSWKEQKWHSCWTVAKCASSVTCVIFESGEFFTLYLTGKGLSEYVLYPFIKGMLYNVFLVFLTDTNYTNFNRVIW